MKFQKGGSKFYGKVDRICLKYSLPLYIGSLLPSIISTYKTELLVNRFKKLLECSSNTTDQDKSDWKTFVRDQAIVTELATFDIHTESIDLVLGKLMQSWTLL